MLTLPLAAAFAGSVMATSFISGVFGMAGGMILMGLLLALLSVPQAMLLHGVAQLASNGWRAWLWRAHVRWDSVACYAAAALATACTFALVAVSVSKPVALVVLGATPFSTLLLPKSWRPDATRRSHAALCGVVCTVPQLLAGVSGPILDLFFVHSGLDRRAVVATKAMTQTFSHALKIAYFGALLAGAGDVADPWLIGIAVSFAMLGTSLARRLLEAMSDAQFRQWTRRIVFGTGTVYLAQGLWLMFWGAA
jgi:uncharacterized membrane protein YfcA